MQQRLSVRSLVTLLLGLWCLRYAPHVSAALLNLSDVPLSLSIKVKPNILFLIDNTGSMDYEVMTKDSNNNGRLATNQPDGYERQQKYRGQFAGAERRSPHPD